MLFTGSWLLLGLSHDGYSQVHGSISVLAAYGAPYWWVLTVGFLVQATAMASAAWLLQATAPVAARLLGVNAVATLVVASARIGCDGGDVDWCTASAHPLSDGVHTAAATIALTALSLAPLAFGLRRGRRQAGAALLCFATMAPLLVAFGVVAGSGWAEKAVVTIGIFWAAVAATRKAAV